MSHHGEPKYATGDKSPEQMNRDLERHREDKRFLEQLEKNHSDHTKAMFSQFTLMYNEIKSMGIDPAQLWRVWSMRC